MKNSVFARFSRILQKMLGHYRLGSSLRIFFENRKNHRKSLEFSKWHAKGDAKWATKRKSSNLAKQEAHEIL